MHIINVAVQILMQLGMFPTKKFETWAAVPNKTSPLLKKCSCMKPTCAA